MKEYKIRNKPAFRYAQSVIDTYSNSFSLSSRLLPRRTRWAVYALYGFCRYTVNLINRSRTRTIDEIIQELNLIKREIMIAYRTGESEHPVIISFIEMASHYGIPIEYPLNFLSGITMDAEQRQYKTYEDLYKFCSSLTGIIGLMMAYILGFQSKAALPYAEKMGVAMHLTNILRDVDDDIRSERLYLPIKEMKQFGVTRLMLTKREMNEEIEALMKFQVNRVHQLYSDACPGIALLDSKSRYAIPCPSRIYQNLLFKIEHNHYNPFLGRVYLTDWEKLKIILKEQINRLAFHRPVKLQK